MAQPPSTRRSLTRAIVPALAIAAIAGAGALLVVGRQPLPESGAEPPRECVLNPPPTLGGAISLIGENGAAVTQADFAGAPTLVYFGFTHCPDICPTTMYAVAEALRLADAGAMQTALISIDPERDTPEIMAQYVATEGFPPGLRGLTGSAQQIEAAARAFTVTILRSAGEGGEVNFGHSSFVYLMGPDWKMRALMSTIGKTPQEIAACLRTALADLPGARP